jgi:uncharacterized sulfatase
LFEESSRSPLIVRVPGLAGQGQVCRRIVEFVDIYPTVLEAAGIEGKNQRQLDGRSLLPLLDNPLRDWEGFAVTQVLRPADARLAEPVMGCSIRTERWRYTEWAEGAHGVELYDHHSDPGEFHNLALDPAPELTKLMLELRKKLHSRASGKTPTTPFNPARL